MLVSVDVEVYREWEKKQQPVREGGLREVVSDPLK